MVSLPVGRVDGVRRVKELVLELRCGVVELVDRGRRVDHALVPVCTDTDRWCVCACLL